MHTKQWAGALAIACAIGTGCADLDEAQDSPHERSGANDAPPIAVSTQALTTTYVATPGKYAGGADANGVGVYLQILDRRANAYFYLLPPAGRVYFNTVKMTVDCLMDPPPRFMRTFTRTFETFTLDRTGEPKTKTLDQGCQGIVKKVSLTFGY